MSINALYFAIEEEEMSECLANECSIINLSKDKKTYSVEQYWDAIRILFIDIIPNILGEDLIDFSDMGEQTLQIDNNEIKNINNIFKTLQEKDLIEMINSESFLNDDFYWKKTLLEQPQKLIDRILGLKDFFSNIEKMQKNHVILVSLG